MLTSNVTLFLTLLGCSLIGWRLYLNGWTRSKKGHEFDGTRDDLWVRQEIAAQEQAWQHLKRLERARLASRKRGR